MYIVKRIAQASDDGGVGRHVMPTWLAAKSSSVSLTPIEPWASAFDFEGDSRETHAQDLITQVFIF